MKHMKLIIAGSRTFNDYQLMCDKLDWLLQNQDNVSVVYGEAKGADALGRKYGEERGCEILSYPADWDKYGKQAGYIRNEQMATAADACVVFWDGKSKGSKHMIDTMRKLNKPVKVILFRENKQ